MKNNVSQLKKGRGENLPVVSQEEKVQKNSMRLYIYLISISTFQGRDNPRVFSHKDFTVNRIRELLGMHPDTIKKYWRILEDSGLIKYEGPAHHVDKNGDFLPWEKEFMVRKKDGSTYYSIPKKVDGNNNYRIMPRETIDKIQNEFLVSELELKIYLLLANMQERFCYMKTPSEKRFSIADLRGLLKLTKDRKNTRNIINSLIWLSKLNLIEYKIVENKNTNLGTPSYLFELNAVNFYTDGGEAKQYLQMEETCLSEKMKEILINDEIIVFDYEN